MYINSMNMYINIHIKDAKEKTEKVSKTGANRISDGKQTALHISNIEKLKIIVNLRSESN